MNMAHSGGEDKAPTNTKYSFKRAASIGSDMLELDVHSTADDELVVIHEFQGIPDATRAFVERAHADGYAVHGWFSGSAPDDAATYSRMIDACVDGVMPAKPSVLETVLVERGIERPGRPGLDPCA
ncbi:glycerophosphodiester phosphodiesterase family protein [Nocardioides sp.]|uniref:glycerophosphodiester phosphodiesterase family protein n=1 Tax=Nocardioides sp. TaxID=35761 RepID=UPI0025F4F0B8|nr:glycerophosphodiester phosphodiesterase family protein [Nocardioides sp.]